MLFDPDWNPATDKQAAARVWRDGQKKRVYVYRFLASGGIEEKVFQRQMSKEGLQKVVDKEQSTDAKAQMNMLSTDDLRDLFTLREDVRSDTHDSITCERCNCDGDVDSEDTTTTPDNSADNVEDIGEFAKVAGCLGKLKPWERQIGTPAEEDLVSWAHHSDSSTIPDVILRAASSGQVSFTFTCQVDGKLTPIDSFPRSSALYSTPSLQAKSFASPVTRELRAPKTPPVLNGFSKPGSNVFSKPNSNGLSKPNSNGLNDSGFVTPPPKRPRGRPPLSRKSPATVLPVAPVSSNKRPKTTAAQKTSKRTSASKSHSSDESSADEYVSDDSDEDDDDQGDGEDDDFA